MPRPNDAPTCAHCGQAMTAMMLPEAGGWDDAFHWVCFNDGCSYYKEGWVWMKERYNQHASYRYAVNPTDDSVLMIPVWSDTATREMIEEDDKGGEE